MLLPERGYIFRFQALPTHLLRNQSHAASSWYFSVFRRKVNVDRVSNMAPWPVRAKSSHRLPKSKNRRRKRSQRVAHINVCSTTDDLSLSQINGLALREEYIPFPLQSGSFWLGLFRWVLSCADNKMNPAPTTA